ncbi:MAG: LemA family protein [Elusimicrobiota bacterium]|jgi:LemA protein|nr:LemA family protein [Elusimicrobiota bacterium]
MAVILILLAVLAILVIYIIAVYNSLVVLRNRVKEAWSDIEVQMKRRYDLIPNLIETVKGYAAHESGTFEKVIQARNAAMASQGTPAERAQAENILSGTLKSLFALTENYPQLKANENFLKLQFELTDTEDRIKASRRFYNTNVLALNNKIEIFPSNLIAQRFAFEKREFFELDQSEAEAARKPVQVKF